MNYNAPSLYFFILAGTKTKGEQSILLLVILTLGFQRMFLIGPPIKRYKRYYANAMPTF
jgi:hypothetical protein